MTFAKDIVASRNGDNRYYWGQLGDELLSTFNDSVAIAAGSQLISGRSENGKMGHAISYSALDGGSLVFGDTGIRAIFGDLDAVGLGMLERDLTANIEEYRFGNGVFASGTLDQMLVEDIVQFGAEMAFRRVEMAFTPPSTIESSPSIYRSDTPQCPSPLELGHYIGRERGIGHGEEATFGRRHLEAAA